MYDLTTINFDGSETDDADWELYLVLGVAIFHFPLDGIVLVNDLLSLVTLQFPFRLHFPTNYGNACF